MLNVPCIVSCTIFIPGTSIITSIAQIEEVHEVGEIELG